MRIEKSRGILGSGQGTGFVAVSALMACSWIVGCGGESGDGGTAGTTGGKGGTAGGKGGSAGSTSGAGGTGNAGSGGTAGTPAGAGGTAGTTAGTAGGAGEDAGGSGGTTGDAGEGNVGGEAAGGSAGEGTGNAGEGNEGGSAGTMGEGGTGGAGPEDTTVRGRIIDFYRHPVPGVTIGINGVDVVTNAQGEFEFENVPEVYDASFIIEVPNRDEYAWVFQGLTRRDPTLQVFQGTSDRSMYTELHPTDGAPTGTQNLTLAVGSEHGTAQIQNIPENGRDFAEYAWFGPAATAATAHSLMWSYDEDSELPTDYVSYTTFPFVLEDGGDKQLVNISVAPTEITQANIGGTVTDLVETGRVNYGFVRFTSGATINLFEDDPGPATFSYLVPALPNGSVTFAAVDDGWPSREYALVHQDGIAPGTTNLALTIPATPSLTAPANGADAVDDTTEFRYQNRQAGVGAVVVRIEEDCCYRGLYVVTSNTAFTIPTVLGGGFTLRSGVVHTWMVEAHGQYASVDEMASPVGYADSFGIDRLGTFAGSATPRGPRTGSGTFAVSAERYFTYAPQQ